MLQEGLGHQIKAELQEYKVHVWIAAFLILKHSSLSNTWHLWNAWLCARCVQLHYF